MAKNGVSQKPGVARARASSACILCALARFDYLGHAADFLEDIRMFIDPAAFSLLSFFFPTLRLWSADVASA